MKLKNPADYPIAKKLEKVMDEAGYRNIQLITNQVYTDGKEVRLIYKILKPKDYAGNRWAAVVATNRKPTYQLYHSRQSMDGITAILGLKLTTI